MVNIPVDDHARIDMKALEKALYECKDKGKAVYAVIAIVGSTEEGSVDPVGEIIQLRDRLQREGMSFVIHVDAAWGGYFKSMVPDFAFAPFKGSPDEEEYVAALSLRTNTEQHIRDIRFTDSVTIDPHKSGYIPYPAGALCYRDSRMKYLVTWTSPYIAKGSSEGIGTFGVEGRQGPIILHY